MAAADVTTMVLRFRDLVTAPGGTIHEHQDVITKEGYVWWGWWSKAGERIPQDVFARLKGLAKAGSLTVYLYDSGRNLVYRAGCSDIEWKADHSPAESPDGKRTPRYYKGREYLAWFQFRAIDAVDPAVLQGFTYLQVDEFFENPPSRYTPFYGKRIASPDELRQQDRTIWFVRPFKGGDATHVVSLLDSNRIAPAHFPRRVIESKSSYLALTSDVHFSVDNHHAFPVHGTASAADLGLRIERCLRDHHINDLAGLVVAGDLTWKAVREEYDLAKAFLQRVGSWAKLDNYQFITCPGNHDLMFTADPTKKDQPITAAPVDARRAYEEFYESLFYQRPNEFLSTGRRFLLAGSVPVEVVALNSSLLEQHKGAFQGHGFVGENQLRHGAAEMGWNANPPDSAVRAYRIAVVHHHLLPVTYQEEAKYGQLYSVALDAEAITRWVVAHRVDLVVHGHMHQPFIAEVTRPLNVSDPGDGWHSFHVLGLGSAGVEASHIGEVRQNTFAVLDFSVRGEMMIRVFTVHPTNPSEELWQVMLYTAPKIGEED
jgi:hypothetical protein